MLCISHDRVCDRIAHCLNGDDEFGCPRKNTQKIFGILFTDWHCFYTAVVTNCSDGKVRLSRGLSNNEGIIELCVNGAFGALWEDILTLEIAKVTCRELFGQAEGQLNSQGYHCVC